MFLEANATLDESLRQVEETATLRAQIERCQRLGLRAELEGDAAKSAAYDIAAIDLNVALSSLARAHEIGGGRGEC